MENNPNSDPTPQEILENPELSRNVELFARTFNEEERQAVIRSLRSPDIQNLLRQAVQNLNAFRRPFYHESIYRNEE